MRVLPWLALLGCGGLAAAALTLIQPPKLGALNSTLREAPTILAWGEAHSANDPLLPDYLVVREVSQGRYDSLRGSESQPISEEELSAYLGLRLQTSVRAGEPLRKGQFPPPRIDLPRGSLSGGTSSLPRGTPVLGGRLESTPAEDRARLERGLRPADRAWAYLEHRELEGEFHRDTATVWASSVERSRRSGGPAFAYRVTFGGVDGFIHVAVSEAGGTWEVSASGSPVTPVEAETGGYLVLDSALPAPSATPRARPASSPQPR